MQFIADAGATEHVIKNEMYLINVRKVTNVWIHSANKNHAADLKVSSIGELIITGAEKQALKLTSVLQTLDTLRNTMSLRKIVNAGVQISLDSNSIILSKGRQNICTGHYDGRFWILNVRVIKSLASQLLICFHSAFEVKNKKTIPRELCELKRDVLFQSQKTEGSDSSYSVSKYSVNIHRVSVRSIDGMVGCRGSSDHLYAKNSDISTDWLENRSVVTEDHSYSQKIKNKKNTVVSNNASEN